MLLARPPPGVDGGPATPVSTRARARARRRAPGLVRVVARVVLVLLHLCLLDCLCLCLVQETRGSGLESRESGVNSVNSVNSVHSTVHTRHGTVPLDEPGTKDFSSLGLAPCVFMHACNARRPSARRATAAPRPSRRLPASSCSSWALAALGAKNSALPLGNDEALLTAWPCLRACLLAPWWPAHSSHDSRAGVTLPSLAFAFQKAADLSRLGKTGARVWRPLKTAHKRKARIGTARLAPQKGNNEGEGREAWLWLVCGTRGNLDKRRSSGGSCQSSEARATT